MLVVLFMLKSSGDVFDCTLMEIAVGTQWAISATDHTVQDIFWAAIPQNGTEGDRLRRCAK